MLHTRTLLLKFLEKKEKKRKLEKKSHKSKKRKEYSSNAREEVQYENSFLSEIDEYVGKSVFSAHEMQEDEKNLFPAYVDGCQHVYLNLRNAIIMKWKKNVHSFLTLDEVQRDLPDVPLNEVEAVYRFDSFIPNYT